MLYERLAKSAFSPYASRRGYLRKLLYLAQVITVIASAILIGEAITPISGAGTLLALAGLVLSGK